ncbi:integrase [Deinococcus cavernae]|uniref:Integrase n=1 Tax=Deinococcus cavernae TaxID=2320857 RepID=A0A418UZC0_9DEIO|nr:tyrosine-type recombinase/integrase [Deinococcus cavernae]RJF68871.1 integrase [Deinococcus cavernae]
MLSLDRLHAMHVRHLRAMRRSESTLTFYRAATRKLGLWMAETGRSDLTALTRADITEFQLWLREGGLAPGGEHAVLRGVRGLLRFGVEEELLRGDVFRKVKLPRLPDDPPPAAQPHEVAELLRVAREGPHPLRDRAMVMLAYDTGLRASELVALTVDDVDLTRGLVTVQRGKGGKTRTVPFGVRAGQAVNRYMGRERRPIREDVNTLFLGHVGMPMTPGGLTQLLERLATAAGLPRANVAPHALRRGFAVEVLRRGTDVFALQQMLGHSTLEMSRRYCRYLPEDLQRQHVTASPGDHL